MIYESLLKNRFPILARIPDHISLPGTKRQKPKTKTSKEETKT